jgi:hypothetical protein
VPGVDLVPFWSFAVMNVYRKWMQTVVTVDKTHEDRPVIEGEYEPVRGELVRAARSLWLKK